MCANRQEMALGKCEMQGPPRKKNVDELVQLFLIAGGT